VRPADESLFPLATTKVPGPRTRRSSSVSARDFALPKPYRKKKFVEDEPRMSRARLAVLTLSGLTIASLVAALALLARDNLASPPVLVIAAPKATLEELPEAQAAAALLTRFAAPSARREAPVLAAAAPAGPAHARAVPHAPRPAMAPKAPRMAHPAPQQSAAPAPDPDVVLITAILTLTMPPASDQAVQAISVCAAGAASDNGCPAIHGMEP
jgi:hypothetical protein